MAIPGQTHIGGTTGIGGVPQLGAGGFDAPPLVSPQPLIPATTQSVSPIARNYTLDDAMSILEQVRTRQMSWQDAHDALNTLPDTMKNQLLTLAHAGGAGPDEIRAIQGGDTSGGFLHFAGSIFNASPLGKALDLYQKIPGIGPAVGNAVSDIGTTVRGTPAALYLAGKSSVSDINRVVSDPQSFISQPHSDVLSNIVKPVLQSEAQQYGPLVQGNFGQFGAQLKAHPLGPLLDALAVASLGVGAAGRAAAASEAISAARVTRDVSGTALVGENVPGTLKVTQITKGRNSNLWQVRDTKGRIQATNFPTEDTAIAHAQSIRTGGVLPPVLQQSFLPSGVKVFGADLKSKSAARIGAEAVLGGGTQGGLVDAYNRARNISHEEELNRIVEEVVGNVLDNPNLRLTRNTLRQTVGQVVEDLGRTKENDLAAFNELREGPYASTAAALKPLGITIRETSDLVRAGAVFIRPAYIPNNWAGNAFLNVVQQGVFAPTNLAKSLVMDKYLGKEYTAAVDQSMGFNAAQLVTGVPGRGYVSAAVDPLAQLLGKIGDQPFRRAAWLHEARRQGFKTLTDVQRLLEGAKNEVAAYGIQNAGPLNQKVADIALRAQEEIIKFGHYNDVERNILRNLIFVYAWMRGAGRYFVRFPMQHAVQSAVYSQLGQVGQSWLTSQLGGVPSYLIGAIPVGRTDKGDPILINPFSVNPLGSGLQALEAAKGTGEVVLHPERFNKYAQTDLADIANPILGAYLQAREGGKSVPEQLKDTVAVTRLVKGLEHPGSGQVYPTSKTEAVGRFAIGSLYPREASQQAITASLEREQQLKPEALIPEQVSQFEKTTGTTLPNELITAYKADLKAVQAQKDFQHGYARRHGSVGFRNLPAQNRAEAAFEYLAQNHLVAPSELAALSQALQQATSDAQFNDLANALWSITGAGNVTRTWKDLMTQAKSTGLTRKRP